MTEAIDKIYKFPLGRKVEGEVETGKTTPVFQTWQFGQPEIRCDNEGWGEWEKTALQAKYKDSYDTNRQFRYGNWVVHLNGGPQASEESWASVSVPVNEITVSDLESIKYDWYAHQNGSAHILDVGPNLVFSAYDPEDHSKRVDFNTYAVDNAVYMSDGLVNRPVEAGWYKYAMTDSDATERVYWYGNNTGSHDQVVTEGGDYYWSNYVQDMTFKNWVIYRIQIMIGYWGGTRSTGDVWIGNMRINDIPVKWEPSQAEQIRIEKRMSNMFGRPTLASRNNGKASWDRGSTSPLDQKGSTGWLARLYGGVQTSWDDWARVNIPVNELRVPELKTAMWSYYMTEAEAFGINMVIWVHDPYHPDYRAEITQQADIATLIKAAGWNEHVLNPSTDQFYFYGETTTKTNLTAAPPNYYGWDDFVADELFNTWTIYRITFEYGWHTGSNEFKDAWVADIILNGQQIQLGPLNGKHTKTVTVSKTLEAEGAYTAGDVMCETDTDTEGTDWDFDFGGTGKIVKAVVVSATTALTSAVVLHVYDKPPTCELDDNAPNTGPVAADVGNFVGAINMPAMVDIVAAPSYSVAVTGTGNLPLAFDSPQIYVVAIDNTGQDFLDDTLLTISLTAEMEDN